MAVGFNKKTIKDLELSGKRVLLRADYNVPLNAGHITDDYRLKASLPTIDYILKQKPAALIIISHLGRPEGRDHKLSLQPVATHLSKLLGRKVRFATDCIGARAQAMSCLITKGEILMLENLRFHDEEEANDPKFAKALVETTGAEVFVQDGFGVVHRANASTDAINKLIPSAAGLLVEKEYEAIESVMNKPIKPLMALIGGAKIADKIEVLQKFIETTDCLAIGGAMANNFLKAEGYPIGASIHDEQDMTLTKKLLAAARDMERKRAFQFLLPVDAVVSDDANGRHPTRIVDITSHRTADIQAYPKKPPRQAFSLSANDMILDIGPVTAALYAGAARMSKTVIWNGTMGITETKGLAGAEPPFRHGTDMIIEAIAADNERHQPKPYSLVGGGDTVGYLESEGLVDDFSFVSTGGGATLELMSGHQLPGLEALPSK